MLYEIITNEALVIPASAWTVAQLIKLFTGLVRDRHIDWWFLFRSGGMPSSHTALVCALATVVAMIQGFGSIIFGIAAILAMVVMYDAAGVRRVVSRQSTVLNRIVKELMEKRPMAEVERDLREFIGHTPFQVIAGAVVGIVVAWLWVTITTI